MSHLKGKDERVLARLVKRYGTANVIGETHEIAGRRRNPKRMRKLARRATRRKKLRKGYSHRVVHLEGLQRLADTLGMSVTETRRALVPAIRSARRSLARKAKQGRTGVVKRRRRNPTVGILAAANPRGLKVVRHLSNAVEELRYRHVQDSKFYKHKFGPGVRLELLNDGSLRLVHPQERLWERFA